MPCSPVILMQDNTYKDANLTKFNSVELDKSSVFHEESICELAKPVFNRFSDTQSEGLVLSLVVDL